MKRLARACFFAVSLAAGSVAHVASAQQAGATSAGPERPAGQGIAVFAIGSNASEEAFALARAVYGSRLRPSALDEVRARVLAGGAPPANASRELRELAEIRAGVNADDAAGRRLLAGIARQVGVEALLVVKVETASAPVTAPSTIGAPAPSEDAADGGADASDSPVGNAAPTTTVMARLFLVESGEFDAARYSPDPGPPGPRSPAAWKSTVTSLEGRFPGRAGAAGPAAATRPAPQVTPESGKSSPFYASGWFWGAVGGAALLATVFYFASRDTSSDTIHLQMTVPK
ncbi:MAG TPA: hypothetical protein VLT33_20325 [Labilithrix sp.]|nr:hypothetical protein [Labilithrix sp.]